MKTEDTLSALFSRFAGQEVRLRELGCGGVTFFQVENDDAVIAKLREEAAAAGFTVELHNTPSRLARLERNPTRLNVHVERVGDNKGRIANRFYSG